MKPVRLDVLTTKNGAHLRRLYDDARQERDAFDKYMSGHEAIDITAERNDTWPGEYWIIYVDGIPAGWLHANYNRFERCAAIAVYLSKAHRNAGVGTKLAPLIVRALRHRGIAQAEARVDFDNPASIALCAKFMRKVGYLECDKWRRGKYIGRVLFEWVGRGRRKKRPDEITCVHPGCTKTHRRLDRCRKCGRCWRTWRGRSRRRCGEGGLCDAVPAPPL